MEITASRHGSMRQRRSGYEPSDADTDWLDSPRHDQNRENSFVGPDQSPNMQLNVSRYPISMSHRRRHSSKLDESPPKQDVRAAPPSRRHSSKSPFKAKRDDGGAVSPLRNRRNISPLPKPPGRHVSPYENNNDIAGSNRRRNQRTPNRDERSDRPEYGETTRVSEKSPYVRRSTTAPRQRPRENGQENLNNHGHKEQKGGRNPSPLSRNLSMKQRERQSSHVKTPSVSELNEMVANIKMSRGPVLNTLNFESTDSISPNDIFFSRDTNGNTFNSKPVRFPHVDSVILQHNKVNGADHDVKRVSPGSGSRPTMTASSTGLSAQSSKFSTESSKISDASGRTTASMKKFTVNRRKSQAETWFSCMRRGTCKTSSKSPERQKLDEASFIERAFVVESLRQFWADKHQPRSLSGFVCHKQEAQLLRQLVSHDGIPHILLKGPYGAGKKALAMALLSEIFGDASRNISHDLRHFQVQDQRMQVAVPVTSSSHHAELNVNLEPNAKYALMSLVKEISTNHAIVPELSTATFRPDYKVIVLYQVDKAAENIQHLIKWIMDCYTDACKLILCCEDDVDIIESVKSRCKVISLDVPVTHEIMEILIQIARKEDFDLSMNFAAKIAAKSKQNLRKAIMALEACKSHNYPFVEDQPILIGWEDVLVELAAEILADPSPKRLFFIRGKLQKLLVDFVHPKLILLKLVEQFLKGVEASLKRELYYWHAYYDKRLPSGTSALLKLEEFVAKFMSIYRRSFGINHQAV